MLPELLHLLHFLNVLLRLVQNLLLRVRHLGSARQAMAVVDFSFRLYPLTPEQE
jgi:hypothetical protein